MFVAAIALSFIALGLWQLDRHSQRTAENQTGAMRMAWPPAPLSELLAVADIEEVRFRRATVVGRYDPSSEVLVRSQVHRGTAGFHVVTPLVYAEGVAVLVNRGWVPLTLDTPPVDQALPSDIEVVVTGWVELSQTRPAFGPADPPDGRLERVNRVDIGRIRRQVPYELAPFFLVAEGEEERLPEVLEAPSFDDAGPHLAYAVQWFGFAVVGITGYAALARKRTRQSTARSSTTS